GPRRDGRAGRPGLAARGQQGGGRRRPGPGFHPRARRRARRAGDRRGGQRAERARRDPAQAEPGDRVPHPDRTGVPRVTTINQAPPQQAQQAEQAGAPSASEIAALIAEAPEPRPTLIKTFGAMMAREFRVLRRNALATFTRAVMQPLLFVFVFAYVFPKIGGGFNLGGAAAAGAGAAAQSGVNFATILVPGLMASMLLMQGIMAVTFPLVMEFSWQRTIEDRALAPVPIRVLAIQKITAGAVQSFIGAVIVFPIVLFVHAAGQAPHVDVTNWALFAFILVFASLLTSSLGLLLGTIMDPRKMQMLFAMILLPATMLGCVYYPWAALHSIRWLQILVLINPMVYMSEGLRAVLTPSLGHMPMWGVLLALIGGTVIFGYLGTRTFTKRVLN